MGNVYLFWAFDLLAICAFLVDTPVCELSAEIVLWASGRALEVSPAQGGSSPPPGVCTSVDVHSSTFISVLTFSRQKSVKFRHKKREIVLLSIPHIEALALPIIVEQTTSEPTPIWIYKLHAETDVHINIAPNKIQYEYTQYSTDRYNHTRDIYRWLCSWL